jgi:hypothetical protein
VRAVRGLVVGALVLVAGACSGAASRDPAHPTEFAGRWLRLRQDQTWGDTMEFVADGSIKGSATYPVPPTLHWEVKRDAGGTPQYCALQGTMGFCRNFRFSGDTLQLLGGAQGTTTFRRVR